MTKQFREIIDNDFPHLRDLATDSALCFVNSDEFLDITRPILHKIIYIGGIGINSVPKPIPIVSLKFFFFNII